MDREPVKRFTPDDVEERRKGIERAIRLVAPFAQGKPSMADELIAERRAEAAAENDK